MSSSFVIKQRLGAYPSYYHSESCSFSLLWAMSVMPRFGISEIDQSGTLITSCPLAPWHLPGRLVHHACLVLVYGR
jgi:hypothetical protein